MWISKKNFNELENRIKNLEQIVSDMRYGDCVLYLTPQNYSYDTKITFNDLLTLIFDKLGCKFGEVQSKEKVLGLVDKIKKTR